MAQKQYQYRKKSKYHITNEEAQIIGDAFEKCGVRSGKKGVSIEKFTDFCRKPSHPVHEIWKRRRAQVVRGADRAAAAYLMAAVEIIVIQPKKAPASAGRAFTTIQVEDKNGEVGGVGYRSSDVARNPDLLDRHEADTARQVRGLADSFAAVAGADRMYRLLVRIATEVKKEYS